MDNSKYIEALDELIGYHKSALRKLEQMKFDMINGSGEELETVYYPGCVRIPDDPSIVKSYYDIMNNRTEVVRRRGL